MPKRYRRVKTVVRKAKWNTVMTYFAIGMDQLAVPQQADEIHQNHEIIIRNGDAAAGVSSTTTHPIIKVRHLKAQLTIPIQNSLFWHRTLVGFCFVPQGYEFSETTIQYHPEWVLCSKPVFAETGASSSVTVSSPLSRNLNSGDSIVFFVLRQNLSDAIAPALTLHPYISYVTRVN